MEIFTLSQPTSWTKSVKTVQFSLPHSLKISSTILSE